MVAGSNPAAATIKRNYIMHVFIAGAVFTEWYWTPIFYLIFFGPLLIAFLITFFIFRSKRSVVVKSIVSIFSLGLALLWLNNFGAFSFVAGN